GAGTVAAPPGRHASVDHEAALLSWDGRRETLVLDLNLLADTDNAVLVVPTPTRATLAPVSESTFLALSQLTVPEIVTERRWFGSPEQPTGAPDARYSALTSPLGPLELTNFTGDQLTDLHTWLGSTGYAVGAESRAALEMYRRDGWSFVAIRLSRLDSLTGPLDPIRLSFDTDRLVYPMRLGSTTPQQVQLYVLSEHRVTRSDADMHRQTVDVDFAGRIAGSDNPTLRELTAGGQDYLTEMSVSVPEPSAVTTDATFAAAPTDDPVRARVTLVEHVQFFDMPAGAVILAPAALAAACVLFALVRTLRKQPG
ncbi:DUF2330 domain-containing protein, partial [Nocardia altamirensis]|uniref:DUF2330 domain-containing protein n=1 Tax=Nocardia altamirensis TaxID=472158 RepID=UPI000A00CC37